MTVLAILQARVSSTRLPGKVMMPLAGAPMLARQIERIQRAKALDGLVVATSVSPADDALEALCKNIGVRCYRGSLEDVLGRYHDAWEAYGKPEHVVRLTGDCPLADPDVIDLLVTQHLSFGSDYTSNSVQATWPDGLDVEVFRGTALDRAYREAGLGSEREHVTAYFYKNPELFQIKHVLNDQDLSALRWTVDEPADFAVVEAIYKALYPQNPSFTTAEILAFLDSNPELASLNTGLQRNEGYARSVAADQQTSSLAE